MFLALFWLLLNHSNICHFCLATRKLPHCTLCHKSFAKTFQLLTHCVKTPFFGQKFMYKNWDFCIVWLISLSKIKFRMQKSQFFNNLLFLKRQNHRTTPFNSSTWFVLSILENGFLLTHPGLAPALANCRVDEYMINDLFFHPFEKYTLKNISMKIH